MGEHIREYMGNKSESILEIYKRVYGTYIKGNI